MTLERFAADEAATEELARVLASSMPPAARPLIIHLQGELGTGKTTFTRGMLRALGYTGPVRSPTYGLVSEFAVAAGIVRHLDLYRLQDPGELQALALRDLLDGSRLWLIEWPERGKGGIPAADLKVDIQVEGGGRRLSLSAGSDIGNQWLAAAFGSPKA